MGLWIFNFENWTKSLKLSDQTIAVLKQSFFFHRSRLFLLHVARLGNNLVWISYKVEFSFSVFSSFKKIPSSSDDFLRDSPPPPIIEKQFNFFPSVKKKENLCSFNSIYECSFFKCYFLLRWCYLDVYIAIYWFIPHQTVEGSFQAN